MKLHCKGVVKRYPLQTAGGKQNMRVLVEGDMYRLMAWVASYMRRSASFF